jgi:hypothetical protein
MRQVKYTRPKDWVDPFSQTNPNPSSPSSLSPSRMIRPSTVCSSSPSKHSFSNGGNTRTTSAHVNRLKILKQSHSAVSAFSALTSATAASNTAGVSSTTESVENTSIDKMKSNYRSESPSELGDIYEEDDFDDGSSESSQPAPPLSLASFLFFSPLCSPSPTLSPPHLTLSPSLPLPTLSTPPHPSSSHQWILNVFLQNVFGKSL